MSEPTSIVPDQHAAAAFELARQLREAARVIRHWGGELRYHPLTGAKPAAPAAFTGALTAVEIVAKAVQQGTVERSEDEAAVEAFSASEVAAVRAGHASIDERTQTVVAALDVVRSTLRDTGDASVDAPYGSGAPRRHHPGALSTILAARIEDLVLALEASTVLKANIGRKRRAT